MKLSSPLKIIKKINATTLTQFKELGVKNIRDLLFYYPLSYDDFPQITTIEDLRCEKVSTVCGKITSLTNKRVQKRKMVTTEATAEDATGIIKIAWFNQSFITQKLKIGDEIYISGKPESYLGSLQFSNPSYKKVTEKIVPTAKLAPIYSSTDGLTQKQIRLLVKKCLELAEQIQEWLPENILAEHKLISLQQAIRQIHFPKSQKELFLAEERLKFDELFLIHIKNLYLKREIARQVSIKIPFHRSETKKFVDSLPFKLTNAQRKTAWQIIADIGKARPMNRLLVGDVDSGKTIVVSIAILNTLLSGKQVVLIAPTKTLARQYFRTMQNIFQNYNFEIALFMHASQKINSSVVAKKELLSLISKNKINLIVGTRSLLREKINFADLVLTIIDERNRLGTSQRGKIIAQTKQEKATHFLSMTTTPIPKSLALTIFGDLDLSVLDELPSNQKKIITKIVDQDNRRRAYKFIYDQITNGRQIFVICPLVDISDKFGIKSVTQEYEKLTTKIFPETEIGLLHGKLKKNEKEKIIQDFVDKKIKLLVSTAAIEINSDVTNVSVILIKNADKFGLAQLHQFRRRIRNSEHQSYCLIFTDNTDKKTFERLHALASSQDGSELAKKDLETRRPSQVYGLSQSKHMIELKIAKLSDIFISKKAKEIAGKIFASDPELDNYSYIKNKLSKQIYISPLK